LKPLPIVDSVWVDFLCVDRIAILTRFSVESGVLEFH